jgi:hypothetical protein
MEIKSQALLTGAGFTCNVGGFLGGSFLNGLTNHAGIKANERISQLLWDEKSDYESVYRTVIEGEEFDDEDRRLIVSAYQDVYYKLDRAICSTCSPPLKPLNPYNLRTFLHWFAGDPAHRERGHIFTLNQDLFIERGYKGSRVYLGLPGIRRWGIRPRWVAVSDRERLGHGRLRMCTIPQGDELDLIKKNDALGREVQQLQYIKLHGSMNWKTSDETPEMVIAGEKEEHIQSVPLLSWYFEKFQEALATEHMHLCVVGYGFGDRHINRALAEAVENGTLERISVVHPPIDRRELEERIRTRSQEFEQAIITAFRRGTIFDFDLRTAFSTNGPVDSTDEGRSLQEVFGPR